MDLRNATWLFLLLLLRPFSGSAGKGQPVPDQPLNILFVLADDWSWPHAGYLGDRTVKTPVLDSLARLGVVFSNAFCAVPSRTRRGPPCSPAGTRTSSEKAPIYGDRFPSSTPTTR